MRILMVEDERFAAKAVVEILKKSHYAVDWQRDGKAGLYDALTGVYDVILLDIMLPGKDGLAILQEIRAANISTPVILLTAKGQIEDKVIGLDFGADDYLAKPFHTDELMARIRALSRRKPELHNEGLLSFGDLQFSPQTLVLRCGQLQRELRLKEAQVLELLLENRNQVVSKLRMIEKVWGYDSAADDNTVEIQVSRLRRQLNKLRSATTIKAVRGAGYMLCEEDQTAKGSAAEKGATNV